MTAPFEWVNDLSGNKAYLFDDENANEYIPFVINRGLANNLDCILLAQQMNLYAHLAPKMQHDFYFYAVKKSKRYGKWIKGTVLDSKEEKIIALLQSYYNVSREKAQSYLPSLKEDELKRIKKIMGN